VEPGKKLEYPGALREVKPDAIVVDPDGQPAPAGISYGFLYFYRGSWPRLYTDAGSRRVVGKFQGVGGKIRQDLQKPGLIGNTVVGQRRIERKTKGVIFVAGSLTEQRNQLVHQFSERKGHLMQCHFARFDL